MLVVTTTVLPGVAVPDTTFTPAGCVVVLAGERMATVGGASAVKLVVVVEQPPLVQAVTVSVLGPAVTETGQAKVPDAEAVVAQSVMGPGPVITTVLPGVAVPEITGAVVVCGPVGATVRLAGAVGAMAVKLATAVFDTPPALLAMAVTEAGPAANVRLLQA